MLRRKKALEPLDSLCLDGMDLPSSFVVFYDHFTYSLKLSSIDYKGSRGRECGLIPSKCIALTGKIAVSTWPH